MQLSPVEKFHKRDQSDSKLFSLAKEEAEAVLHRGFSTGSRIKKQEITRFCM